MDIARFEDLLDRYGGDVAHWPVPERAAAASLLASTPTAQVLLAEMIEVETMLGATRPESATSIDPIAARATRHAQETRTRHVAKRAGIGMAAAAVLALGVLLGDWASMPRDLNPDRTLAAAFDAGGVADVD